MLKDINQTLTGKTVAISGFGNVAQYAAYKAIELEAKVITFSNSDGVLHDKEGFSVEKIKFLLSDKNDICRQFKSYTEKFGGEFLPGKKPWEFACDLALPCATQNELDEDDAKTLIKNGCILIAEGANMPCTAEAIRIILKDKIAYGPGKAANAGGVAVSGLEMSQNRIGEAWTKTKVDLKLHRIMQEIHNTCVLYGKEEDGSVNYLKGANIGGFIKVAHAMCAQGLVQKMRTVAELPHPDCKITIFAMNQKFIIKFEQGNLEQTFKVDEMNVTDGVNGVFQIIDDEFTEAVITQFQLMRNNFSDAYNRHEY